MKQIFALILLLSLLACNKDEDEPKPLSERHTEKEIFNAMVGTWRFSRLAYDADFKNIEEVEYKECAEDIQINFQKDSAFVCKWVCADYDTDGWFYVQIGGYSAGDTDVHIKLPEGGLQLSPTMEQVGGAVLHHYTDSTLVFSDVGHYDINDKPIHHLYSEFKRVK